MSKGIDIGDLVLDYEGLLGDSVSQILKHEDPTRFFAWMQSNLARYFSNRLDQELVRAVATQLGRAIWNGTPLPGHDLQPDPVPEPSPKELCACGSGKLYMNCCGNLSAGLLSFDSNMIWPFVVTHLSKRSLETALKKQSVPIPVVVFLADQYHREGRPHKAVKVLELLFPAEVRYTGVDSEYALNLLCNAYDELGYYRKKSDLLFRIIESIPRSPLRSAAWQRLAAIFMDAGEHDKAWSAFKEAMQDFPDSPGVGMLEVQLLCAQELYEQAKERARFWIKRLHRSGLNEQSEYIYMMEKYLHDPADAFVMQSLEAVHGAGAALRSWLMERAGMPLPEYRLRKLTTVKIETDKADQTPDAEYYLETDAAIALIEQEWESVFALEKPSLVHEPPLATELIWLPEQEEIWMEFVRRHEGCFSSFSILDDLAAALMQHPQFGAHWMDEQLLQPVLERSLAMLEKALALYPNATLPWMCEENRAALRNLHRLINLCYHSGDLERASRLEARIIAINPADNHGYRVKVINDYLRDGLNEQALALSERYPDDAMADMMFGRILALYRQKQLRKAESELKAALKHLPKIVEYLVPKRIKKPKIDPYGFMLGGDDQAWLYRDSMREVWQSTPGALEWLQKAARLKA